MTSTVTIFISNILNNKTEESVRTSSTGAAGGSRSSAAGTGTASGTSLWTALTSRILGDALRVLGDVLATVCPNETERITCTVHFIKNCQTLFGDYFFILYDFRLKLTG